VPNFNMVMLAGAVRSHNCWSGLCAINQHGVRKKMLITESGDTTPQLIFMGGSIPYHYPLF